jgi:ferritin-like metal-binding protein YciE
LENVFLSLDEKVRGKHCDGIAGIIEEGQSITRKRFTTPRWRLPDCSARRAEHYELAAYGTVVAWATAMGHADAAAL